MSDYDPVKCLQEEVDRFKSTNQFTPMLVTGFYIQAAVVLDEHKRQKQRIAELEREKDLAIKEANRRDQKWQQGLNEECGVELNYGLPHIDEKRPTFGEFIHELRQRVKELEHKNTELKAYLRLYDQSDQLTTEPELRKSLIETGKERDQLRLQVVRLREALKFYASSANYEMDRTEYGSASVPVPGTQPIGADCGELARQALSETPAQSAKEALGPVVELLMELKPCIVSWSRDTLIEKLLKEIARLKRLCE